MADEFKLGDVVAVYNGYDKYVATADVVSVSRKTRTGNLGIDLCPTGFGMFQFFQNDNS